MTELSRRSFFTMTAGGILLSAAPPVAATDIGGPRGVRAIMAGAAYGHDRGHFYILERQKPDGTWESFQRLLRRSVLMPHSLTRGADREHVRIRERVTLLGPHAFERGVKEWQVTTIVNRKGEALAFATTMEMMAPAYQRWEAQRQAERAERVRMARSGGWIAIN